MEKVQTVEVLKALADETRIDIVRQIAKRDCGMSGCDIVKSCQSAYLAQPTLSHHFNKLVTSGVLRVEKVGTSKVYRMNSDILTAIGIDPKKL